MHFLLLWLLSELDRSNVLRFLQPRILPVLQWGDILLSLRSRNLQQPWLYRQRVNILHSLSSGILQQRRLVNLHLQRWLQLKRANGNRSSVHLMRLGHLSEPDESDFLCLLQTWLLPAVHSTDQLLDLQCWVVQQPRLECLWIVLLCYMSLRLHKCCRLLNLHVYHW